MQLLLFCKYIVNMKTKLMNLYTAQQKITTQYKQARAIIQSTVHRTSKRFYSKHSLVPILVLYHEITIIRMKIFSCLHPRNVSVRGDRGATVCSTGPIFVFSKGFRLWHCAKINLTRGRTEFGFVLGHVFMANV